MIEIVLSIHIRSLRIECSMKNKFPYHILFPEIPTYFEITANQTPFLVSGVLRGIWINASAHKTWRHLYFFLICFPYQVIYQKTLSDPRLFNIHELGISWNTNLKQDVQNSWHMRQFLAPKCLILALFSSPTIIFKRNFTTILSFFIKH